MDDVSPRHRQVALSRRRLGLAGLALLASGGGWWALYRYRPSHGAGLLSVEEAHGLSRAGALWLVDIRTPAEWRRTGLPEGAVPLDMRRDDFEAALHQLVAGDPERPIALICAGGVRSARLSRRLLAAGFDRIRDVPEGLYGSSAGPGWLASQLPVTPWEG